MDEMRRKIEALKSDNRYKSHLLSVIKELYNLDQEATPLELEIAINQMKSKSLKTQIHEVVKNHERSTKIRSTKENWNPS